MENENINTESGETGVNINHVAAIERPRYMPESNHFLEYLFPAQPATNVPRILEKPMIEIANPPNAAVVSIPKPPHQPLASIGELISVTNAGKCAVMNAS